MATFRVLAVLLVFAAPLAGCGGDTPGARTDSGSSYVDSVKAALDPAAEMAQLVTAQIRRSPDPGPWPSADLVDRLLRDADRALADLRAVPLEDVGLRAQRDALADDYAIALGHMRDVARDLRTRDRGDLRSDAPPFFATLRDLSSRP